MKILVAGDTILTKDPETGLKLRTQAQALWSGADYRVVNLEAPIIRDLQPIKKASSSLFHNEDQVNRLRDLKIDYFCLANNHIFDYGLEGIKQTVGFLGKDRVLGVSIFQGEVAPTPYFFKTLKSDDVKVALINLSESEIGVFTRPGVQNHVGWINSERVTELIQQAKKDHDFLVCFAHAGLENIDIPQPEWRSIYRKLTEAGVDVIIGHHPHIPQGYEFFKGKLIVYSLGNFMVELESDEPFWNEGIMGELELVKNCSIGWKPHFFSSVQGNLELLDREYSDSREQTLNFLLTETQYWKRWNDLEDELWEARYRHYAKGYGLTFTEGSSFLQRLKIAIKGLLARGITERPEMLYHNLHIETHKWFFERFIEKKLLGKKSRDESTE